MDTQPSLLDDADFPLAVDDGPVTIRGGVEPAASAPVAQVLLDTPVPHLSRPFDFGVPARLDAEVGVGAKVRVRFAGSLTSGYVLSRSETTDHRGELAPIERVTTSLPVLGGRAQRLVSAVADRWAGTLSDVVRLAVPARHAAAERAALERAERVDAGRLAASVDPSAFEVPEPVRTALGGYLDELAEWAGRLPAPDAASDEDGGDAGSFDGGSSGGGPSDADSSAAGSSDAAPATADARTSASAPHGPRAACALVPGDEPGLEWRQAALAAAARAVRGGMSALILVPDHRELSALEAGLGDLAPLTVRLSADQGPSARWRAYASALLGTARIVIGTRAAVFAPLDDLGLVVIVDDGSDHLREQRAPYPHAREVALIRCELDGAAFLALDSSRTLEVQRLIERGWAVDLTIPRSDRRGAAPLVLLPRELDAPGGRLPAEAFALVRDALGRGRADAARGPVLVQVPRAGHTPVVACSRCGDVLRCPSCSRPLGAAGPDGPLVCASCRTRSEHTGCPRCSSTGLRAVAAGLERTFEELGRAFPGAPVVRSGGSHIRTEIGPEPAIVVATTGAEPYAERGYAAALLLDSVYPGTGLRGIEGAVARRLRAASLVRSSAAGGRVLILDEDPTIVRTVQTFDPVRFATAELADRAAVGLPPAVRTVLLTGTRRDLADVDRALAGPDGTSPLRTLLTEEEPHRRLSAVAHRDAASATRALRTVVARRSAAGLEPVYCTVDPAHAL